MNDTSDEAKLDRVECPAAKDPAVRLFILGAMFIGFGIWCLLDLDKYPYKPAGEDINAFAKWAFNHFGAYVLPLVGLIPTIMAMLFLRRRLVADLDGIGYKGKKKIAWAEITKVDAAKLKSKGILYLHYGDGKLTLDSWKFRNFHRLVAFVEEHVPPESVSE